MCNFDSMLSFIAIIKDCILIECYIYDQYLVNSLKNIVTPLFYNVIIYKVTF